LRRGVWIVLLTSGLLLEPCHAQTLSARPRFFADPVLAVDPAHGELVLGRTTLHSAMRIFASDLQDSVRVPLAHSGNPLTLPSATMLSGQRGPTARYLLDIGAGRYTLYFDGNQRLIAVDALGSNLPRLIRRADLVARYSTLRPLRDSASVVNLEAPLGPCISMLAFAWDRNDGRRDGGHVEPGTIVEFGYRYTCPTKSAEHRAALPPEF
jgi:hypothetical protein